MERFFEFKTAIGIFLFLFLGACSKGSYIYSSVESSTVTNDFGYSRMGQDGKSTWCDHSNNYCGTGDAKGISNDGQQWTVQTTSYKIDPQADTGTCGPVAADGSCPPTIWACQGANTTDPECDPTPVDSIGGTTKDVDLQRAQLADADLDQRAQILVNQYQMNLGSARQLAQLSNQMNHLIALGQLTSDDQMALAKSALGVAGISMDQVNEAVSKLQNGDSSGVDELITKGASNLGLPSEAMLRDQILPSLGISL